MLKLQYIKTDFILPSDCTWACSLYVYAIVSMEKGNIIFKTEWSFTDDNLCWISLVAHTWIMPVGVFWIKLKRLQSSYQ